MSVATPDWVGLPQEAFDVGFRPRHNMTRDYLHRTLVRALEPVVASVPSEEELSVKPLTIGLLAPLPPRLRFYVYGVHQHASERQAGTFKIQLTGVPVPEQGAKRLYFDRSDKVRPMLVGYHSDHRLFILWDADMHDMGDGFPWSKNVQAPPDVVWQAVAVGLAEGTRRLKKHGAVESIVAARPSRLVEALELRIRLSNQALCEGTP